VSSFVYLYDDPCLDHRLELMIACEDHRVVVSRRYDGKGIRVRQGEPRLHVGSRENRRARDGQDCERQEVHGGQDPMSVHEARSRSAM
jgi:hypothetical protein